MRVPFLYVSFEDEGDQGASRTKLDQASVTLGYFHLQPVNVQGFKVRHALALATTLHFTHNGILLAADDIAVHQVRIDQKGAGGFTHYLSEGDVQVDEAPIDDLTQL